MVSAIINITEDTNRVLNIVKAVYGLKGKSESVDFVARQYEQKILSPELRSAYVKKALRIQKQKPIIVGTAESLRKRYG